MLERAVRKLGRNLTEAQKRAAPLLTSAESIEIERAIRTLQVIKGKTYSKALLKENGKILNELSFDIGIGSMLKKHNITQEELNLWFEEAEKTKFEGHIFQPLPDKADAWNIFQKSRRKLDALTSSAQELHEAQQQLLSPAPSNQLTRKSVKIAIELGMWSLMTPEQRQEAFAVLEWEDLPKKLKLEFFHTLPKRHKSRIFTLPDPDAREEATRQMFCRHLNKPESGGDTTPESQHNHESTATPNRGSRNPRTSSS